MRDHAQNFEQSLPVASIEVHDYFRTVPLLLIKLVCFLIPNIFYLGDGWNIIQNNRICQHRSTGLKAIALTAISVMRMR